MKNLYRKTRLHDEKGNLVDPENILHAVPAFFSALAKRLLGLRPMVPMISYRGRAAIEDILTTETDMIEFGSGNSTPWFACRVRTLVSIEDDPDWYTHVERVLASSGKENVRHELRTEENYADVSDIEEASLDFAFVDGTDRAGCIKAVVPKLKPGAYLYLDNSDKDMTIPDGDLRRAEAALLDAADVRGGSVRYFSDFSPTNFFVEQGMLVRL